MKAGKWKIIAVVAILLCLVGGAILFNLYRKGWGVWIVHCRLVEEEENRILLREQDVDYNLYETIYIYYVAEGDVATELYEMAKDKEIDLEDGFYMRFSSNEMTDFKRKDGAVYLNVRELIDMSHDVSDLNY